MYSVIHVLVAKAIQLSCAVQCSRSSVRVHIATYWLILASKLMSISDLSNITCCLVAVSGDTVDTGDSKNAFLTGLLMKS